MRDLERALVNLSDKAHLPAVIGGGGHAPESMTLVTLVLTSCHSSGGVGGGSGQVTEGSSWVGVELPPQLLVSPVDVAAPEAREASCLALNASRQLGKMGSFTMFQWRGSAAERAR